MEEVAAAEEEEGVVAELELVQRAVVLASSHPEDSQRGRIQGCLVEINVVRRVMGQEHNKLKNEMLYS